MNGFREGTNFRRDAWNLKLIGVVPSARRKGIGKKLVDVVCETVGPVGLPAYDKSLTPLGFAYI